MFALHHEFRARLKAMEVDQDNDGPPAAAEGPAPLVSHSVSLELKIYRAAREGNADLLQRLIDDTTAGIVSRVYEDRDEYEDDEDYYAEFEIDERLVWAYIHYAAFYGHTECVRIILDEGLGGVGQRAFDSSSPLMVACSNLPDTVDCVKFLCEYYQNLNITNEQDVTALQIALAWKPNLEIVRLLVDKGADIGIETEWAHEPMMLLFMKNRARILQCPDDEEDECPIPGRQAEIAEVAMYLANQGCVRGAFSALLHCSEYVIRSPPLMEQLVECFLENGAVLNDITIVPHLLEFRPLVLTLFAKKYIIYLDEIPPKTFEVEPSFTEMKNAITVALLQGLMRGVVPHAYVTKIHDILQRNMTPSLPKDFLPLETLYGMTKTVPSLKQQARAQIRRRMDECRKFRTGNFQELELPTAMIDYLQLDDLGYGTKVEEIMKHMQYSPYA